MENTVEKTENTEERDESYLSDGPGADLSLKDLLETVKYREVWDEDLWRAIAKEGKLLTLVVKSLPFSMKFPNSENPPPKLPTEYNVITGVIDNVIGNWLVFKGEVKEGEVSTKLTFFVAYSEIISFSFRD
jgi:hypothetical protein